MNIAIKEIELLLTDGSDKITITTNLPDTIYPFDENMKMVIECAKNTGKDYIKTHFNVFEPKIINVRKKEEKVNSIRDLFH